MLFASRCLNLYRGIGVVDIFEEVYERVILTLVGAAYSWGSVLLHNVAS